MVVLINMANDGSVINASVIAIGMANQSFVSIASILRTAIVSGANRIILMHNYPSGNPEPSHSDELTTKKLATVCNIMEIELVDHIIVGGKENIFSMREEYEEFFYTRLSGYEEFAM